MNPQETATLTCEQAEEQRDPPIIVTSVVTQCEINFCKSLCKKLVSLGAISDEEYFRFFY